MNHDNIAMAAVSKDHPIVVAFDKYKASESYANTKKWAKHEEHVDGSLWAAFERGYAAAHKALQP